MLSNKKLYNLSEFIGKTYNISQNKGLGQRGAADLIEKDLTDHIIDKYNGLIARSRKSIEDVGLLDYSYLIDIKTKWVDEKTKFHMPNLISVKRIMDHYKIDTNYIEYVFVDYTMTDTTITIIDIEYFKLEEIGWDSLHIQNLGKGQLQIKDANKKIIKFNGNRTDWLNELKNNVLLFIDKQILKRNEEKIIWENY